MFYDILRLRFDSPSDHRNLGDIRRLSSLILLAILFITVAGCCASRKDKAGFVMRGDWEFEVSPTKTLVRSAEDPSCGTSGGRKPKAKTKHQTPCGRFGCLRCALAPSTGDTEDEIEDEEEDDENEFKMPSPNNFSGMPPFYSPQLPGIPIYPGQPMMPAPLVPGQMAMMPQMPQPIPVVNPQTGQRQMLHPAFPGQPGILMLHAATGQPIMMNPNPPTMPNPAQAMGSTQQGVLVAQIPGRPPMLIGGVPINAQTPQNAAPQQFQRAQQLAAVGQMGIAPNGFYAQPGAFTAPTAGGVAPWAQGGLVLIDARTGQAIPVPSPYYAQQAMPGVSGGVAPGTLAAAVPPSTAEAARLQEEKRSNMTYPKYHALPIKPVFQRSEGITTAAELEEEKRQKREQLERTLGMKVPEEANIAPNGVNQQILQTSASGAQGGGPANGSPFSSISGALGLREKTNVKKATDREEQDFRLSTKQQIARQQMQIRELQDRLENQTASRSRPEPRKNVTADPASSAPSESQPLQLWLDLDEGEGEEDDEEEDIETETHETSRIALQSMSTERAKSKTQAPKKPSSGVSSNTQKSTKKGLFGSLLAPSEEVVVHSQLLEERARKQAARDREKNQQQAEQGHTLTTQRPPSNSGNKRNPLHSLGAALGVSESSESEEYEPANGSKTVQIPPAGARRVYRSNETAREDILEDEEIETEITEAQRGELPYGISFEDDPEVVYIEIEDENTAGGPATKRYVAPKYAGTKPASSKNRTPRKSTSVIVNPSVPEYEYEYVTESRVAGAGKSVLHGIASVLNRPVASMAAPSGAARNDLVIGNPLLRQRVEVPRHEIRNPQPSFQGYSEAFVYARPQDAPPRRNIITTEDCECEEPAQTPMSVLSFETPDEVAFENGSQKVSSPAERITEQFSEPGSDLLSNDFSEMIQNIPEEPLEQTLPSPPRTVRRTTR